MLHPSTKKLIDRLAEMTELGKLDWTESSDGSLVYSTEGYSVCLPDGAGEVIIQSIDGKELERAAADALAGTMTDQGTPYAQIVAEMGAEAARFARGTETAISSLMAGMEEPEPDVATDASDLSEDSLEDPGDESAALDSEGIANHEISAAAAADVEAAPEAETPEQGAADEPIEGAGPDDAETATTSEPSEAVIAVADTADESDEVSETADASEAATDLAADDVDTENDVTEAVARLADEVNTRDDADLVEDIAPAEESEPVDATPSAVGVAAATAVGVVASAAGLDQDDGAEPIEDSGASEIETDPVVADASPQTEPTSGSSYVPFGTDDRDPSPVADAVPVADMADTSEAEAALESATPADTAETFSAAAPTLESANTDTAEDGSPVETEPEFEDTAGAAPAEMSPLESVAAPEAPSEPEPETLPEVGADAVTVDAAMETTPEREAAAEPAPVVATAAEPASDPEPAGVAPLPAPASDPEGDADVETVGGISESETEPVLAAPSEPQTYSLSGIGAGFGLGALAAKTEASGIPGPSAAPPLEPEKIVIDATDDVLPEIEGNLNLTQMEAAVSEINFGNKEKSEASSESEPDDDSNGDILKPRTRFNPWD